jgi:hypothetical protein
MRTVRTLEKVGYGFPNTTAAIARGNRVLLALCDEHTLMKTVSEHAVVENDARYSLNFHGLGGIGLQFAAILKRSIPAFSRSPTVSPPFWNNLKLPLVICPFLCNSLFHIINQKQNFTTWLVRFVLVQLDDHHWKIGVMQCPSCQFWAKQLALHSNFSSR